MRAPVAALAGIGASVALVFSTSILPLSLLLRVGHRIPSGDPRLVALATQALSLALVLVVLRVPIRPLLRGLPSRQGIAAAGWLTLGTLVLSALVTSTIVSTGGPEARSGAADILAGWAREFPSTGLAGYFAFYALFVPVFEELLYRALIIGRLLRLLAPWLALVVSTLLFAAGHSSWVLSGLSGLAYGLLYLRFRSLWLCMLSHSAHNLVSSAGATLLAAHLHDIQLPVPMEMNLLSLQLMWTFLAFTCLAMFLRHVFAEMEGGPSTLLLGPCASVRTRATG